MTIDRAKATRILIREKYPALTLSIQEYLESFERYSMGPVQSLHEHLMEDRFADLDAHWDYIIQTFGDDSSSREIIYYTNKAGVEFSEKSWLALDSLCDCWVHEFDDLQKLNIDEFMELYDKNDAVRRNSQKDDDASFDRGQFHSFSSEVPYANWLRLAGWTVDEAAALSLGRDPDIVNGDTLNPIDPKKSVFLREFLFRCRMIKRAADANSWGLSVEPSTFCDWACKHLTDLPPALLKLVKSVGDLGETAPLQAEISDLRVEIVELRAEIAALRATDEDINERSLDTLYRLVLIMAVDKYRYDPRNKLNTSTKQIEGSLVDFGSAKSNNTILSRMKSIVSDPAIKKLLPAIYSEIDARK